MKTDSDRCFRLAGKQSDGGDKDSLLFSIVVVCVDVARRCQIYKMSLTFSDFQTNSLKSLNNV